MKHFLLQLIILCAGFSIAYGQGVGIGTSSPNANAILDIRDSAKGVLIPRMVSAHRKAYLIQRAWWFTTLLHGASGITRALHG